MEKSSETVGRRVAVALRLCRCRFRVRALCQLFVMKKLFTLPDISRTIFATHLGSSIAFVFLDVICDLVSMAMKGLPSWMLGQAKKVSGIVPQKYDYIMVIDFEATCDEAVTISPQEIIEFPCLKLSTKTFDIESEFHHYVRPKFHPKLTEFCTHLTGITQDTVQDQPDFVTVLKLFETWLQTEAHEKSFIVLTCGNWDINTCLRKQCEDYKIDVPAWAYRWINLKKVHKSVMGNYPKSFAQILSELDLKFEGRPHSGIDDSRNIAKAVKALALKGHIFESTNVY